MKVILISWDKTLIASFCCVLSSASPPYGSPFSQMICSKIFAHFSIASHAINFPASPKKQVCLYVFCVNASRMLQIELENKTKVSNICATKKGELIWDGGTINDIWRCLLISFCFGYILQASNTWMELPEGRSCSSGSSYCKKHMEISSKANRGEDDCGK